MSLQTAVHPERQRSQYIDFWNDVLVPKFIRWKHILVDGLTLHSEAIFPTLAGQTRRQGHRCRLRLWRYRDQAGATGRAFRIGSGGRLLRRLSRLRSQGRKGGRHHQHHLLDEDVQTYPFEPVHDFCFSRFGTQFFENPVAGLRNMRKSLKPGGIMTMIVWRGIKDNPWLGSAKDVVLRFLPPPGENAQTCGPGPFSMADTGVVTKQLEIAGYKDIEFDQVDAKVFVGKDVDDSGRLSACDRACRRSVSRSWKIGARSPR